MGNKEVYSQLSETMKKRGGLYPGMDIPEFYEMAEVLFTPDEAAISNVMPRGLFKVDKILPHTDKNREEVSEILETMADKGLCFSVEEKGARYYSGPPFVPGIMEHQFMRGTTTERDKEIARVIHNYKKAVDSVTEYVEQIFPEARVIPVNEMVDSGSKVQTYSQVMSYIDKNDEISVATCYCRHEAKLLDENDDCSMPDEVCMQFGISSRFAVERGIARNVTKEEAKKILKEAEEAGLVHCTSNIQEPFFICNCCSCHCLGIHRALKEPNPGNIFSSGYQAIPEEGKCILCGDCLEICPSKAIVIDDEVLIVDYQKCFGCGLCASKCPEDAILMKAKEDAIEPPVDMAGLKKAIMTAAEHK